MARILQDGTVQTPAKAFRSAWRKALPDAIKYFQVVQHFEQHDPMNIVDPVQVLDLMEGQKIQFIGFSCLGTYTGREELIPDLKKTYFFRDRKVVRRAQELSDALQRVGAEVSVEIFLPDLEPRRTWGWTVDQAELTYYCQCMCEEADLPEGWKVTLWSEVEAELEQPVDFQQRVEESQAQHHLLIRQIEAHLRQFREIKFTDGLRMAAIRQVAAYALEGRVLEQVRLESILLQSETPAERKDRMYQLCRERPLPIIHPFL